MILFEDIPYGSERMGIIWTLGDVAGACMLEFGPEGSTHYAAAQHGTYNGRLRASLFTTGLSEREVVFGDPGILEKSVRELIDTHHPSHLFVVPSAVCEIIGMDLDGLCLSLSRESDTRVLSIGGSGLDVDYTAGVERVLSMLAEHVVRQPSGTDVGTYNVIGSSMDWYNYQADLNEIERLMTAAFGLGPKAVFTTGSSMGDLMAAGEAACNIVIRKEGLACAKILEQRFGQPYFYGAPYGLKGTIAWLDAVGAMIRVAPSADFIKKETLEVNALKERLDYHRRMSRSTGASVVMAGNYDLLKYCGPFIRDELHFQIKGSVLTHPVKAQEEDGLLFFRNDSAKYTHIAAQGPDFLLADAVTLRHFSGQIPGIQVSNPNLGAMKLYAYTPFMGFRGAQVLIQELANLAFAPATVSR